MVHRYTEGDEEFGIVAAGVELTEALMRSAFADADGVLVVRDCQTGEEFV